MIQEICIKYCHQQLLSGYFREELKRRIWGKACPRKVPWGPAWSHKEDYVGLLPWSAELPVGQRQGGEGCTTRASLIREMAQGMTCI